LEFLKTEKPVLKIDTGIESSKRDKHYDILRSFLLVIIEVIKNTTNTQTKKLISFLEYKKWEKNKDANSTHSHRLKK
jgi:hypothetical protein